MKTIVSPRTTTTLADREALVAKQIEQIGTLYASRRERILEILTKERNISFASEIRMKALLQQINREISFLDERARDLSKPTILSAYERGMQIAAEPIIEAGLTDSVAYGAQIHTRAVNVVAAQLAEDLLAANNGIKRNSYRYLRGTQQQLIREETISRIIGEGLVEGQARRTVSTALEQKFREKMEDGKLLTINGRNYDPAAYSRMVARTRTREATSQGTINMAIEFEIDLMKVSSHSHASDSCDEFEGKIYSISGKSSKYPRLDNAPPFHPNCKHVLLPQPRLEDEEEEGPDKLPPVAPTPPKNPAKKSAAQLPSDQADRMADGKIPGAVYLPKKEVKMGTKVRPSSGIDWDEVKTISEVERIAETQWPETIFDFHGAKLDAIKPAMKSWDVHAIEKKDIAGRIKYIGTARKTAKFEKFQRDSESTAAKRWRQQTQTPMKFRSFRFNDAFAVAMKPTTVAKRNGAIGLNPKWFGNKSSFEKTLQDSVETGFHPKGCDAIESVFSHEFGHHVDFGFSANTNYFGPRALGSKVYSESGTGQIAQTISLFQSESSNVPKTADDLSKWSTKNKMEAWSEAFASIYHTPKKSQSLRTKRQAFLLDKIGDSNDWSSSGIGWSHLSKEEQSISEVKEWRMWANNFENKTLGFVQKVGF